MAQTLDQALFYVVIILLSAIVLRCLLLFANVQREANAQSEQDLARFREQQRSWQIPTAERMRRVHQCLRTLTVQDNGESVRNLFATTTDTSIPSPQSEQQGTVLSRSFRNLTGSVRSLVSSQQQQNPACSICLEDYEAGERVSTAKHDGCDHVFHRDCIVRWLSHHDACPLCRIVILPRETESQ